jgi:hypothetical protein
MAALFEEEGELRGERKMRRETEWQLKMEEGRKGKR